MGLWIGSLQLFFTQAAEAIVRTETYVTPPVPLVTQNSMSLVTPETANRAAAANSHRPKPRPVSQDTIAPTIAPPAPTGEITFPTQLIKLRKAPSGCAPVCPWTATLNCGLDPRFWAAVSSAISKISATTRKRFLHRRCSWYLIYALPLSSILCSFD